MNLSMWTGRVPGCPWTRIVPPFHSEPCEIVTSQQFSNSYKFADIGDFAYVGTNCENAFVYNQQNNKQGTCSLTAVRFRQFLHDCFFRDKTSSYIWCSPIGPTQLITKYGDRAVSPNEKENFIIKLLYAQNSPQIPKV